MLATNGIHNLSAMSRIHHLLFCVFIMLLSCKSSNGPLYSRRAFVIEHKNEIEKLISLFNESKLKKLSISSSGFATIVARNGSILEGEISFKLQLNNGQMDASAVNAAEVILLRLKSLGISVIEDSVYTYLEFPDNTGLRIDVGKDTKNYIKKDREKELEVISGWYVFDCAK